MTQALARRGLDLERVVRRRQVGYPSEGRQTAG